MELWNVIVLECEKLVSFDNCLSTDRVFTVLHIDTCTIKANPLTVSVGLC